MRPSVSRYRELAELQRKLAPKVCRYDDFQSAEIFCGVDASYIDNTAFCAAVVMNLKLELLELRKHKVEVRYPYVPGYFMLREAPVVKRILSRVKTKFDVLLIDGHGILHPRRCGLASYLGITLGKPSIGIAKSLLCGKVKEDNFIEHEGEILGYALKQSASRYTYVSTGHRIGLDTAVKFVKMLTKAGHTLPEPIHLADLSSKQKKREELRR